MPARDLDRLRIRQSIPKRSALVRIRSLLSEFSNKRHVLSRLDKSMAFSMNAIFGELGLKELVSLHLRKDLLSNLAIIMCEKVEKFKKFQTILV